MKFAQNTIGTSDKLSYDYIWYRGDLAQEEWGIKINIVNDRYIGLDSLHQNLTSAGLIETLHDVTQEINLLYSNLESMDISVLNKIAVFNYLCDHHEIISIVTELAKRTYEKFKDNTQFILKLTQDPDIDDKHLSLIVRRRYYPEDFIEVLDTISEDFDEKFADNGGWILLTTDFDSPKL